MDFAWPDGARIAVTVSVMFEAWSEGKAPEYSAQTTQLKPGVVNRSAITWAEFGGKVGVWRVLRTLERCRVPATFAVSGRCAELYPDAVRQIVRSGHEVAAHAYANDQQLIAMDPDEERATIYRCLDILESATGERPVGWQTPAVAYTAHTTAFLAEAGLLYQGDMNDANLPRREHVGGSSIVRMPTSDFPDNRVLRTNPRDYYDVYKDTFDYLYRHEPMALLTMTVHCHSGGRPLITAMVDEVLRYYRQFPDVWFARFRDVAGYFADLGIDEVSYAERFFGAQRS
jgi:allantoinase